MVKIKRGDYPAIMEAETESAYRYRLTLWYIQTYPGRMYEEILEDLNGIKSLRLKNRIVKETLVRNIKIMVKRGFVEVRRDPQDARRRVVVPTKQAAELMP